MATFNTAHHESGGVILFSGELILLFCDNVNLTLPQTSQNETGRLYLTTHRMVFTSKSMKSSLKSFSAPFYSMHDLNLEQPIFGANYIKGKVNDANTNNAITFKLKFNSGGAIEYGQALQSAARLTRSMAAQNAFQPPPPYTASASQYYQAPPTVYQPAYNCGFVLPTDIFNQAPPAGFIYTSEAPPPYPGLGPQQPQAGFQQPQTNQYPAPTPSGGPGYPPAGAQGYPPAGAQGYPPVGAQGYPPAGAQGYPPAGAPVYAPSGPGYPPTGASGYPSPPGYPGASPAYPQAQLGFQPSVTGGFPPQSGYPSANGYPPNQSGYPPTSGYPPSQPGYPGTAPPSYPAGQPNYSSNGAPGYPPTAGYPPLNNDVFSHASAPMGSPEKKAW